MPTIVYSFKSIKHTQVSKVDKMIPNWLKSDSPFTLKQQPINNNQITITSQLLISGLYVSKKKMPNIWWFKFCNSATSEKFQNQNRFEFNGLEVKSDLTQPHLLDVPIFDHLLCGMCFVHCWRQYGHL